VDVTDPTGYWTIHPYKPVHENIAFKAAKAAGYPTVSNGLMAYNLGDTDPDRFLKLKDTDFANGLFAGVDFVDAPDGLLGMGAAYALNVVGVDPNTVTFTENTFPSPFGKETFRHAMTTHDQKNRKIDINAIGLRDQVANWISDQYYKALTAVSTVSWIVLGHSQMYHQGFELGKAIHTLADSFCASHVWRGGPDDHVATGPIYMFQDYNAQDHGKHKLADAPVRVPWTPNKYEWTDPYFKQCYYAAIDACAELLRRFKADLKALQDAPENGRADMLMAMQININTWLKTGPLALATDAQGKVIAVNGGTDPWFIPDETTSVGPATAMETYRALA